jgi:type IV pilus assembly protein PilE
MNRCRISRNPRGFTFLELALVLAITAILATVAVVTYNKYVDKARMTEARTALKHLQKTQTIYFTENGAYTDNVILLDYEPTKYNFYIISVVLDNTGYDFTGYAAGTGAMTGDLWFIHRSDEPTQDNSSTFR